MMMKNRTLLAILAALATAGLAPPLAQAQLQPNQVLVVANAHSAESVALARTYMKLRKIPAENLLLVKTTTDMSISRADYNAQIAHPVRTALKDPKLGERIRCLCLIYGVPVQVEGPEAPRGQAQQIWRQVVDESHRRLAAQARKLEQFSKLLAGGEARDLPKLKKLLADSTPILGDLPSAAKLRTQLPGLCRAAWGGIGALPAGSLREAATDGMGKLLSALAGLEGLVEHGQGLSDELRASAAQELAKLDQELLKLQQLEATERNVRRIAALMAETRGMAGLNAFAVERLSADPSDQADASLDSELALLWRKDHELSRWLPNPMHWSYTEKDAAGKGNEMLMTARLDGPSAPDVLRMIKSSIQAEADGLRGKFYIDAGGMPRARTYDKNLLSLAEFLTQAKAIPVRLDTRQEVFAKSSAPDAALYVGWYSLGNYVPAFLWNKGAVGWHISSGEAGDLRDPKSQSWCVKMIQNGVVATLGAFNEPYLSAFPLPQEFFPLLMTGKATLAECYWRCIPHTSWRMSLLGDPLYNPFKGSPRLSAEDLPKGLVD